MGDAEMGQTALFFAVRNHPQSGGIDGARYLINQRCSLDHVDKQGQAPLFYAVRNRPDIRPDSEGVDCARHLIKQRCSPDHVDKQGQTPQFSAVLRPDPECMEALIMEGANLNTLDILRWMRHLARSTD